MVATEVKNLAERSAIAAEEIDKVAAESVFIAENSGKMLTDIVPNKPSLFPNSLSKINPLEPGPFSDGSYALYSHICPMSFKV